MRWSHVELKIAHCFSDLPASEGDDEGDDEVDCYVAGNISLPVQCLGFHCDRGGGRRSAYEHRPSSQRAS